MAPKSKLLKIFTLISLVGLLMIIFWNIFNTGQSYHYINVERELLLRKQQQQQRQQELLTDTGLYKDIEMTSQIGDNISVEHKVREPSMAELISDTEKKLPYFPFEYFMQHSHVSLRKSENCAVFPSLQMIQYYNTYWQTLHIQNSTFYLYGAYYDERPNLMHGPVVRILAMTNHYQKEFPTIYCQLWFENVTWPVLTPVIEYNIVWSWTVSPNVFYPYLMTCKMPKDLNIEGDPIPKVVSLAERECDRAYNSLKIIYEHPKIRETKHQIAVCVKGLEFPYEDISLRLVEWLELLRILGVHKVYAYQLALHPNVGKVLEYYERQGFLEMQKLSMVGGVENLPDLQHWLIITYLLNKRLNELVPYNDCFYRNMYKYDYIALIDIDEVIIPKGNLTTWQDLLSVAESQQQKYNCSNGFASICALHVYFPLTYNQPGYKFPAVTNKYIGPSYMQMLSHPYRFKEYDNRAINTKCLHNTQQSLTLHNHYTLTWLNGCKPLDMSADFWQLHHYRNISAKTDVERELVWDDHLERYREPLMERCTKVFDELKLLG